MRWPMQINELHLERFRNYREVTLFPDPACNVIFGENAQGKTNLLEAIVYLSCGTSPRAKTDREMIAFDESSRTLCPDGSGRTYLIYFKEQVAGFAIHLTIAD